MTKIQNAVTLAKQWAADNTHGYDQNSRWGPDYDCSSFLISALEQCGIKVKSAGATYTGNMKAVFQRCGFEVITSWTASTLQPGDILLNDANHTAMYIGNGQLVQARSNENGGTTGGKSGDQTGREIAVSAYYSYPWDCVLRYRETPSVGSADSSPIATQQGSQGNTYTVKAGDSWWRIAQTELGNGTLMSQLAKLNGKTTSSVIHPGDVIKLWDDDCESCKVEPQGTLGAKGAEGASGLSSEKATLEAAVKRLGGRIVW